MHLQIGVVAIGIDGTNRFAYILLMKMTNPASPLSTNQLKRALKIRQQIDGLEQELKAALGRTPDSLPNARQTRPRMSLAVRRKIAAGQKARWARTRGASGDDTPKPRARRVISPAARAKLSAAARARWAKAKAKGRSSL